MAKGKKFMNFYMGFISMIPGKIRYHIATLRLKKWKWKLHSINFKGKFITTGAKMNTEQQAKWVLKVEEYSWIQSMI